MTALLTFTTSIALALSASATPAVASSGATLSGTVSIGASDRLAREGEVRVEATHTNGWPWYSVTTRADGAFSIPGVSPGEYTVRYVFDGDEDYPPTPYSGAACGTDCPKIAVTADLRLDFTMPLGRGPFGTVTDRNGHAIEGIELSLIGETRIFHATSAADGTYRFSRVTDGLYKLVADDPLGEFSSQGYPDAAPDEALRMIDLRNGAASTALDMALRPAADLEIRLDLLGVATPGTEMLLRVERQGTDGAWRQVYSDILDASESGVGLGGLYPGFYAVTASGYNRSHWPARQSTVILEEGRSGVVTVALKRSEQSPNRDFSGDGNSDVLAIAPSGDLVMYTGGPTGWISGSRTIGWGWGGFDHVFAAGDFSGDGLPDLLARNRSGGLWLYRGDGYGGWLAGGQVGWGWGGFDAIISPGDFNGDGTNDVIARQPSGVLWLYTGNGSGGFGAAWVIGSGWEQFRDLMGAGDLNGDHTRDLLGVAQPRIRWSGDGLPFWVRPPADTVRCTNGDFPDLHLYKSSGDGGWHGGVDSVGSGWCAAFNTVVAGGDRVLVGRDHSGNLWRYTWDIGFGWHARQQIGWGWNGFQLVG